MGGFLGPGATEKILAEMENITEACELKVEEIAYS
jgi:hypothetical protein